MLRTISDPHLLNSYFTCIYLFHSLLSFTFFKIIDFAETNVPAKNQRSFAYPLGQTQLKSTGQACQFEIYFLNSPYSVQLTFSYYL